MTPSIAFRGLAVASLAWVALSACSSSATSTSSASSSNPAGSTSSSPVSPDAVSPSSGSSTTESSSQSSSAPTSAAPTSSAPTSSAPTSSAPTSSAPASSASSTSASKKPLSSGRPFTVKLPAGYKEDRAKESGIVAAVYLGPVADNFATNVIVTREAAHGLSVKAVQKLAVGSLKKGSQIRNLSSASDQKIDGEPALSYSFEDTQQGFKLKQGQVVVVHADYAYVITFTAPVSQFAKQQAKAVQLIKSLRFS